VHDLVERKGGIGVGKEGGREGGGGGKEREREGKDRGTRERNFRQRMRL
jgi:hypothetical protein